VSSNRKSKLFATLTILSLLVSLFSFANNSLAAVTAVETMFGDHTTIDITDNWIAPPGVTSVQVEAWGGGGTGGPATGNNSRGGGGAGAQYAIDTGISVTGGSSYAVTIASQPATSATTKVDGRLTQFVGCTTQNTHVCAQGGVGGAVNATANSTGVAGGAGSSSGGIGDTVYAGGSGGSSNGTASGGGGGGAGSTGAGNAGSGQTAGTAKSVGGGAGGTGVTVSNTNNKGSWAGGGGSGAFANNTTDRAGGQGSFGRMGFTYSIADSYPAIVEIVTGNDTADGTCSNITMPANITAGDLLLIIYSNDGTATTTAKTNACAGNDTSWTEWTQQNDSTNVVTSSIMYKSAAGGDTLSIGKSASEQGSWIMYQIRNTGTPTGASVGGNSTNSDPPNLSGSYGNIDYLWIATRTGDASASTGATDSPANYSSLINAYPLTSAFAVSTTGAYTSASRRYLAASSEDPGTFTSATEQWAAWTIAVPAIRTILADGATNNSSTTIGPGASATDAGVFSLQTTKGTGDTVNSMTVTLAANSYNNLGTVGVYTTGDSLKCESSSWGADTTVELSSCSIAVTTSATDYKIKITPKSHASMPAVPGASYDPAPTVTSITSANSFTTTGSDSADPTVSVDNASPGNVSNTSGSAGNAQVIINYTAPADADLDSVVVLRRAGSAVADVPVEGATYTGGEAIGTATVANGCVDTSPSGVDSCIATGLSNGTAYHFKIFTKDSRGNYDAGVVTSGSPFTPTEITTLGAGNHVATKTVAPGSGISDFGEFTFSTSAGTDSITALDVLLKSGQGTWYTGIGEVRITSNDGSTTYFSPVSNPSSNTVSFSGGTAITGTTSSTTYKIRITPKAHTDMPAVPGDIYISAPKVSNWTGTNAQAGSDSQSGDQNIDNASPAGVTSSTATPGDTVVDLAWTNPGDADFDEIIVLRRTGGAVTDVPTEGSEYSVGNTIGSSTVACNTASTSCQDTGLSNGTAYYYKIFTQDTRGNYNAGTTPTGSPATPSGTTTLGDGTDGGNSTIGPGASATEIDRFSLVTAAGTDTVTGMTVTLGPASAYNNIGTVDVQTTGGSSKCSNSSISSNTVALTSCGISVDTNSTEYVVKITPLSHANMPAVPGASYATTATVTAITATNTTAGTDTDSATITVDNASPAGVTSSTATAGNALVDLAWTNPTDSDFTTGGTVVVLRRAGSAVADVPTEGTTYAVGSIAYDAGTSSGDKSTEASATFSHTTGSGSNRVMLVAVQVRTTDDANRSVSSVTYNGVNLALAKQQKDDSIDLTSEIWYLANPASGANNVVVTLTAAPPSGSSWHAEAMTLTGVEQSNPIDATAGASHADLTVAPTVDITTTVANAWVVDSVYSVAGVADPFTAGNGQTERFNHVLTTRDDTVMGSTKGPVASPGTVTMSWANSNASNISAAVALKPAGAVGNSTVACVVTGSPPATSCQDTGLTNGTAYHYKIFTQDSRGNYDAGTVPTGSPATPAESGVTVSGNIYEPGTTVPWDGCDGATNNVSISVNGGAKTSTTCNASTGAFSKANLVTAANDIVTVFIDDSTPTTLVDTGLVTRYYLNEAASGTAPTQALDSSGNDYDLTVDYGDSTLSYDDPAAGNRGLKSSVANPDGDHAVYNLIPDSGDTVRSEMGGVKKATLEVSLIAEDFPATGGGAEQIFGIYNWGNGSPFGLAGRNPVWFFNIGTSGGGDNYQAALGIGNFTTKRVVHAVLDTTQADPEDRIKVYLDGTPVTVTDSIGDPLDGNNTPPQDATLDIPNYDPDDVWLAMMNGKRASGGDLTAVWEGTLFYAAMYNDAFSQAEVDNNVSVLLANDDPGGVSESVVGSGALYTRAVDDSTNITSLALAKNAITLRYETGSSITNSNINTFDQSNDSAIPIASTGTNVTVDPGVEILVDSSKTYAPGGNVTADSLKVSGTYTGGSGTTTLNKGLTIGSGGTFTAPATLNLSGNLTNNGTFTHNSGAANVTPGFSGYGYSSAIIIDAAQVAGSANLTNFPVLVSGTYDGTGGEPDLRGPSVPGKVTNANGYDLIFAADAAGLKPLDFEIEKWDAATGELVAWVKIPSLDYDDNTTIYMLYGNSAVTSSQENITGVWDSNYKGVWHLKETDIDGGSGDIKDSTSNANNGTTGGMDGSDQVAGKVDGSFDFDGVNDNVSVIHDTSINPTGDMTLSAWINPRSFGGIDEGHIFGKLTGSYPTWTGYRFEIGPWGLSGTLGYTAGDHEAVASGPDTIALNSWQHVVATVSGSNVTLYINGVVKTSSTDTLGSTRSNTLDLQIGTDPAGDRWWDGKIDEARVSNVARSPDWITTEYNNQNAPGSFYSVGAEAPMGSTTTIAGANNITFNTFTVSASAGAGKSLKFHAGNTYTFSGAFSAAGENGNILALSSDSAGNPWTTTFNSTASVGYLSVKDSACSGGNNIDPTVNLVNLGNNGTCWTVTIITRGGGGGAAEPPAAPPAPPQSGGGPGGGGEGGAEPPPPPPPPPQGGGGAGGGGGDSGALPPSRQFAGAGASGFDIAGPILLALGFVVMISLIIKKKKP